MCGGFLAFLRALHPKREGSSSRGFLLRISERNHSGRAK